MQKGAKTTRYHIRFGRHETDLYLERREGSSAMGIPETERWWVYAEDITLEGKEQAVKK